MFMPIVLLLLCLTPSSLSRPMSKLESDPFLAQAELDAKPLYAKRQTTRAEVLYRSHLKATLELIERNSVEVTSSNDNSSDPNAHLDAALDIDLDLEPSSSTKDKKRDAGRVSGDMALQRKALGKGKSRKGDDYPACVGSKKSGYAHYPGWRLMNDDLSGAVPVNPESACVNACNKYGGACSGIFYSASTRRCFLKGTHTQTWSFESVDEDDGTDLIGGCALWSSIVPAAMDATCCRN